MRKNLITLTDTGMRVKDVGELQLLKDRVHEIIICAQLESLLSSTNVKGFPIVSSDGALTLFGYIDRNDIRHVLGELCMVLPIKIEH